MKRRAFVAACAGVLAFASAGCSPRPAFRAPIHPADPAPAGPIASRHSEFSGPGPIVTLADSTIANGAAAQQLAALADTWMGTPYRRGGLDSRGIDCSALARTVMAEFGVSLPRTTAAQRQVGHAIERDEMAPGDLLFFRLGSGRVNHVGVALDADRFLHASTTRGVVVDRLNDTYFGRRFVEARRVSGG